ncbi:MAG: cytochrome c oxidase subunit II [Chloroflexi bacterium]|nr:MAG: cytochrome c oxidase subunit II [Chloroflexota bacterium]TMF42129.1 MAG: cytochrome c oxidase subunit II [Chloroflexota bacterium]
MSETNIEGNSRATSPAGREPDHFRRVMIIWIVLSIIGIVIWALLAPVILPKGASDLDGTDDFTITVLTDLAIPVAMFVFVFLAYSLFFFRTKDRPTEDPVPLKPRPGLQIGWLGITSVLCLFLFIWGMVAYYQETAAASASNTLVVQVTAQQWQWTFNYPQYGATSQGAQVIELPVNRPVQFLVTSKDVLHGFAIRALGVRIDANPGEMTNTPVVTPTQIGNYTVNCVELCGLFHSDMWEAVNVVSDSSFNSWIVSQGGHP